MRELWVPLSGAIAQQKNVETIANNVANVNTPGFKKDQAVFRQYLTDVEKANQQDVNLPRKEWKPEDFYRTEGKEDTFVQVDGVYTVQEQGQLTPTGNHFDLALNGPGFLEVLTPNGVRFTRNGSLSINAQGQLVTTQGFPLLRKDNPPIVDEETGKLTLATPPEQRTITVGGTKFSVTHDGQIFTDQEKIGDLSVVEFNELKDLEKEGNSLYKNERLQNLKIGEVKTSVNQGFVEQSNVNAVTEMSNLINANRNFESIQRVIKTYDSMSQKAVNEISKF